MPETFAVFAVARDRYDEITYPDGTTKRVTAGQGADIVEGFQTKREHELKDAQQQIEQARKQWAKQVVRTPFMKRVKEQGRLMASNRPMVRVQFPDGETGVS